MKARITVAVIWIPVIFLIIFVMPPVCLAVAVGILSAIASHELLSSTRAVASLRIRVYSAISALLIPVWFFCGGSQLLIYAGLFIFVLLLFAEAMLAWEKVVFETICIALFSGVVIPFALSALVRLYDAELGKILIILPFLISFSSDGAALFAGMLFGKHKLAPSISPKKTVEGSAGGFVGALVLTAAFGLILKYCFALQVDFLRLSLYAIIATAISQFGDLAFSFIKRQYGIKDYGNVFPGHGGVLDRFDSVIFSAPLIELLVCLLPAIYK